MAKASPAFQFYAADFSEGTDDMTLAEVGGYTRLLCSQWAKGGVPGDNVAKLAVIMRCTPATAKGVWRAIAGKFVRGDDGLWRNARLETERAKQERYRALQAARGKESAQARLNRASTEPRIPVEPSGQPEGNPKPQGNSLSLSLSSKEIHKPPDPTTSHPSVQARASSSPLVMSPLRFERLKETHAFVGSRLRVPHVLHDELRTKLGGDDPESMLQAWYADVNTDVEMSREAIPDVFEWLRPKFKAWASASIGDAELRKFVEGA